MSLHFFQKDKTVFVCQTAANLSPEDLPKLTWLFAGASYVGDQELKGLFIGPRPNMVTPWSTNAVEITQNMGIVGMIRIEEMNEVQQGTSYDKMLFHQYSDLDQDIFAVQATPESIKNIIDIATFNKTEGLALSDDEVQYLENLAARLGRLLTDSEVFGFSQVNSEHCRHKIFNGTFVIDGEEKAETLFSMIKKTSKVNPNRIVSAYKDNVAFVKGPEIMEWSPSDGSNPSLYKRKPVKTVLSLKAETHNFPTTVEPFNGAATGSGGEIRDRLAGGQGALPLAGTAVYMTSYSRLANDRPWEQNIPERSWLYRTPMDILIKASNGASDFGNKFGQPLITGSLLTFEHKEGDAIMGYDKVIMQAGGIGYGHADQAQKHAPAVGDKIIVLGGENYRIGMGGAAVSSADTGAFSTAIELNAVQRSNPEMQKRAANTIRALVESADNPIVSIHDHGAGGHLNCLSELVEEAGGRIDIEKLPIGDKTLSAKEIIGNESQERMGLVVKEKDIVKINEIAARERAPIYVVGEITGDGRFSFYYENSDAAPMDIALSDMFGSSPKTILQDTTLHKKYAPVNSATHLIQQYLEHVLTLEAVACKDWLTNKVDRCVGGLVAKQQTCGPLQLPLNNCGVMSLDFESNKGVATSIGHAPIVSLIDEVAGSKIAIIEALANIVWAPIEEGIKGISLSANWMWPCKNAGEDARLYNAVSAVSEYAIALGINIPTGKDSLSMAQKYKDRTVLSPGTVIISAGGECSDIRKVVEPVLQKSSDRIYYIPLCEPSFSLGGTSLAQTLNSIGSEAPKPKQGSEIAHIFDAIQHGISQGWIMAGHDVSSGGLLTTLLEMCFADNDLGVQIDLDVLGAYGVVELLFNEAPALIVQSTDTMISYLENKGITYQLLGNVQTVAVASVKAGGEDYSFDIKALRDIWFKTSYLLDQKQTANGQASERFNNYKNQQLKYEFPNHFDGHIPNIITKNKPLACVLREKGSNSEREMSNAMYRAGFEVRDVHMTDLISGREDLTEVRFLGAVGGFSNSDVLGSAKGWAGACMYNENAQKALFQFFQREDTLSVGICNGCQLFLELEYLHPEHDFKPKMRHNTSQKHESIFTSVSVQANHSVMMSDLAGSTLGIWVSHGEGRFDLPQSELDYHIVGKYGYEAYPANPNGSDYNTAILSNKDGRHLVSMPHFERSLYPWNWAHYPKDRAGDEFSPWGLAFANAAKWLKQD